MCFTGVLFIDGKLIPSHPIPLLAQTTGNHLNGKAKDHEHRKRKFTLGVHPMTIPDLTNSRSAVLPRSIRSRSVYVEPSGGMAGVLLKKEPSEVEVFTDSDGRAMNFFRVILDRHQIEEFKHRSELAPYTNRAHWLRRCDWTCSLASHSFVL